MKDKDEEVSVVISFSHEIFTIDQKLNTKGIRQLDNQWGFWDSLALSRHVYPVVVGDPKKTEDWTVFGNWQE